MSRWEQAREIVSSKLKGTENELSIKELDKIRAYVFFRRTYWTAENDTAISVGLLNANFMISNWKIHGSGDGLLIEYLLVDATIPYEEPKTVIWWKDPEALERYVHLTSDQAKELIEEMEKTDPEGAELLKRKLLTGVVEGKLGSNLIASLREALVEIEKLKPSLTDENNWGQWVDLQKEIELFIDEYETNFQEEES